MGKGNWRNEKPVVRLLGPKASKVKVESWKWSRKFRIRKISFGYISDPF